MRCKISLGRGSGSGSATGKRGTMHRNAYKGCKDRTYKCRK